LLSSPSPSSPPAEPLPSASPLWRHPRVALLPHVAAQSDPRSAAAAAAANVALWASAQHKLAGAVDLQAGY
jgi:glyoxylate/hydroxypyruvate reductase A